MRIKELINSESWWINLAVHDIFCSIVVIKISTFVMATYSPTKWKYVAFSPAGCPAFHSEGGPPRWAAAYNERISLSEPGCASGQYIDEFAGCFHLLQIIPLLGIQLRSGAGDLSAICDLEGGEHRWTWATRGASPLPFPASHCHSPFPGPVCRVIQGDVLLSAPPPTVFLPTCRQGSVRIRKGVWRIFHREVAVV